MVFFLFLDNSGDRVFNCSERKYQQLSMMSPELFKYYVQTDILNWKDYVTEWNGKLDEVEIKIQIFDLSTGEKVNSVLIEGNGTYFTMGGYHPQHIISKEIGIYVKELV
ncbi:MAG: DUF4823 domain-containing protein [Candidatus Omnitrophota bacterium]